MDISASWLLHGFKLGKGVSIDGVKLSSSPGKMLSRVSALLHHSIFEVVRILDSDLRSKSRRCQALLPSLGGLAVPSSTPAFCMWPFISVDSNTTLKFIHNTEGLRTG